MRAPRDPIKLSTFGRKNRRRARCNHPVVSPGGVVCWKPYLACIHPQPGREGGWRTRNMIGKWCSVPALALREFSSSAQRTTAAARVCSRSAGLLR